jgi:hypothetical protein
LENSLLLISLLTVTLTLENDIKEKEFNIIIWITQSNGFQKEFPNLNGEIRDKQYKEIMLTKEKGGLHLHAKRPFFNLKHGGHVFLRNFRPLPKSTTLQPRRLYPSVGYMVKNYVFKHKKQLLTELQI